MKDELRFVTTSSTARDMRLLYKGSGDSMLHYWGFSYGTVLGSVFSDMFPNEVGRMVLDGTVDAFDYMAGNWTDNLVNTQGTYEKGLLGECVKAGERCALNKITKGRDLKTVMDEFYKTLQRQRHLSWNTLMSNLTSLMSFTLPMGGPTLRDS
jgi:pimeloyl-ACP methyl ester carboxylesterase